MPLQNRVDPSGQILSSPARGTLMGNRGTLHDAEKKVVKTHSVQRWIICVLKFKGRRRELMTPGKYTELFFLDEASALAAGHRPCQECQRERALEFKRYWALANRPEDPDGVLMPEMDRQLHHERIARRRKVTWQSSVEALPDGAFFEHDGQAYLVWEGNHWRWSFEGYHQSEPCGSRTVVNVLTPKSTVRALQAGFGPSVHRSITFPST
ncbi:hypothetical protein LWH48_12685 [Halomonas sp. G15]|uniref:hypothetical protein n=1 Tax=Halomonas sp. G15 TaxID=2903521 RepID=UPI001E59C867|nr:hypothetical protein [Halomonas sp. G15]MCE0733636.1 hypothetical protein [Halomonas sp. G15]